MTGSTIELLAIGNELLLGDTIDTNSAWIARRLAAIGVRVARTTIAGDDEAVIATALAEALRRTGAVICTGGLGPTRDDMTRHAVAQLYERELHIDESWLDVLRARYARRGIEMPAINRVQGEVPAGGTLLPNPVGTAPGIALEDERLGLTILLPGVPSEMRVLIDDHVVPLLSNRFRDRSSVVTSRVLRTAGLSEARLAEIIDDIAADVAPLTLAFLPHGTGVDLRLTCWGDVPAGDMDSAFDRLSARLHERLGVHVYALDDTDLAVVVGRMLRERSLTLAIAESCTGGLVAKRITDEAGASDYMLAGFVTYSNSAKQDHLGVTTETLALRGAVSALCAEQMAIGARVAGRADIAVSVTGIAGPGGGSEEKPVGTVWFGVALSDDAAAQVGRSETTFTRMVIFPGTRAEIRERAAQTALDLVRRALLPDVS